MAAVHDKAREQRWKQRGGRRLHARITARASEELDRLALAFNCPHRDVIEGLLLGTIDPKRRNDALRKIAERERLSESELAIFSEGTL